MTVYFVKYIYRKIYIINVNFNSIISKEWMFGLTNVL